jgi:hypothetical protein
MKSRKISTAFGSYQLLVEQLTAIYNSIESDDRLSIDDKNELRKIIQSIVSKSIIQYKTMYSHLADFMYISEIENRSDELFSFLIIY